MGGQWKWGAKVGSTVTFQNNTTVSNCYRMSEQLPGASKNFSSVFIASGVASGSTVTFQAPNTYVAGDTIFLFNFNNSGSYLDNQTLTVLSAGLSTSQFEAVVSGAASFTDNGNAGQLTAGKGGNYLSLFCRAGDGIAFLTRASSTNHFYGNTIVAANPTVLDINCGFVDTGGTHEETNCNTSPLIWTDNDFIGYTVPFLGTQPGMWFFDPGAGGSLVLTSSYNNYFGLRSLSPDACGVNNITCNDPLQVSEPAQPWPGSQTALDAFNPLAGSGNSFYPTSGSPLVGAGVTIGSLVTDYYAVTRPSPPTIGAVEPFTTVTLVTITVIPNPASITLPGTINLQTGASPPASTYCTFSDSSTKAAGTSPCIITWTDTNTHSTINGTTGVVTGVSVGSDTITATISSIFGTGTVTMSNPSSSGQLKLNLTLKGPVVIKQ